MPDADLLVRLLEGVGREPFQKLDKIERADRKVERTERSQNQRSSMKQCNKTPFF